MMALEKGIFLELDNIERQGGLFMENILSVCRKTQPCLSSVTYSKFCLICISSQIIRKIKMIYLGKYFFVYCTIFR